MAELAHKCSHTLANTMFTKSNITLHHQNDDGKQLVEERYIDKHVACSNVVQEQLQDINARLRMNKPRNTIPCSLLHLDIGLPIQILEEVAALEVLVWMDNGLELVGGHDALVFGFADLLLVNMLEDSVALLVKLQQQRWGRVLTGCTPYGTSDYPYPPLSRSAHPDL